MDCSWTYGRYNSSDILDKRPSLPLWYSNGEPRFSPKPILIDGLASEVTQKISSTDSWVGKTTQFEQVFADETYECDKNRLCYKTDIIIG